MATKPSPARNKKKVTTKARPKPRIVASKRSRLNSRPLLLVAVLLFGAIGTYLLLQSGALAPDETLLADEPERGLLYEGKKIKTKGPCAGGFDVTTEEDERTDGKEKRRCAHLDPTPKGVDIRERIKKVDENLVALAAHDEKNKPAPADDETYQPAPLDTAETVTGSSMDGIYARDWACFGTGIDGPRVQLIYAYPAGGTNRLATIRSGLNAIARRTNQVFWVSGYESGNAHHIRYATAGGADGCALSIAAVPIPAADMDSTSAMRTILRDRGFKGIASTFTDPSSGVTYTTYKNRKYHVWVDREVAGKCGQGEIRADDTPGQTNANNTAVSYAYSWKGCWNYAEPHEIMHMLGGVQPGAPYSTAGYHCRDERDVMCYKDATNVVMVTPCTRAVDFWRFDCRHDTYYRGNSPASGYLSNHWNAANNQYLTR